jgi:L-alanine-DL-glutamate epimerase-like enolase superfamily enzyme
LTCLAPKVNSKPTDIRVIGSELYFLPIKTRVPLKFGSETLTEVTCARVRVWVEAAPGQTAEGWGETPLSVQWVWPSQLSHDERGHALQEFCQRVSESFAPFDAAGHSFEISHLFQEQVLPSLLRHLNQQRPGREPMPWLAALVCYSSFDLALHDAYGQIHQCPVFETYNARFMSRDLASFLTPAGPDVSFAGKYPQDFLLPRRRDRLTTWHLVGGLDPLEYFELTSHSPDDGYPLLLQDWIKADELKCLKIKLRGTDSAWDYERLVKVGRIGLANGVEWLSADFNCTVQAPEYVVEILDRLQRNTRPFTGKFFMWNSLFLTNWRTTALMCMAFPPGRNYFWTRARITGSACDWAANLGWTGVALKTCKTLTGALLSACWGKAHGLSLMVQDLTNPMLAQIPHLLAGCPSGHVDGR